MLIYIAIAVWLACSVIVFGLSFALFQRGFPLIAREGLWLDFWVSSFLSLFGPVSLIGLVSAVIFSADKFHGFKFLPNHEERS